MKILVLGDGLMGKEFVNQLNCDYVSRKKDNFDINIENSWYSCNLHDYSLIINCIANIDTYSNDREKHWEVNYVFINKLINFCNKHDVKLVHISSDYIYANSNILASEDTVPVSANNWYSYTKLLSDGLVQLNSDNYLLIRTSFKPNPFPYEKAWIDQIGNFDYVNVIVKKIINLIVNKSEGVFNVGTEIKTIFDLAKQTKEDVKSSLKSDYVPSNITMNLSKYDNELPFFSICIPTYEYNGKGVEYLEHSFNILYVQTFKNFEIVISDHSLNNDIEDLCERWKDLLKIRYFRNEIGRGVISPNINFAMKKAIGKWIKIIFHDDFLFDENSLMLTYEELINNENIEWLISSCEHSNDGKTFYRNLIPTWNINIINGNNTMGCPTVMTIKNKEDKLYFDEELNWMMDCDYYQRMYFKYNIPHFLNQTTVVSRTFPDRLSSNIPEKEKIEEMFKIYNKYNVN